MQTTNPIGQRRNNLAVLARAIWKNPGISRRELVDQFDIDESSVSRLVSQLIATGLVESSGAVEGPAIVRPIPGGRRRIALTIRREFGQVWGLTLWRDRVRVSIVDVLGTTLGYTEQPLPPYDGDWGGYLDRSLATASNLSRTLGIDTPLLGIGFGIPGWVDSDSMVILRSDEFALKQMPSPRTWPDGLPTLWENDANCGAWSGLGRTQPNNDELYVLARFLENGPLGLSSELSVGFGLIVKGQLHRGWRHNAGEFLSALWKPGSRSALGLDDETFGQSRADDQAFAATVGEILRNLRFAAGLLDPQTIHLGGDLKNRFEAVLAACDHIGWSGAADLLHALPADTDEVSLGAALLVLDELFQFPSPDRRTLFRGYGTGKHDPLWRGIPVSEL